MVIGSLVYSFLCNCHFQPCDKMPPCGHVLVIRGMLPDGSPRRFFSFPTNGQMGCFHFCCFVFAFINSTIANIFFISSVFGTIALGSNPRNGISESKMMGIFMALDSFSQFAFQRFCMNLHSHRSPDLSLSIWSDFVPHTTPSRINILLLRHKLWRLWHLWPYFCLF